MFFDAEADGKDSEASFANLTRMLTERFSSLTLSAIIEILSLLIGSGQNLGKNSNKSFKSNRYIHNFIINISLYLMLF